jgi:uncharacterized membrane protein YgcG
MTGRFPDNRSIPWRLFHPLLALLVLWAVVVPTFGTAGATTGMPSPSRLAQTADIPIRNPNPSIRIEDPIGLLTAQQFQVLNAELDRLARLGRETVVLFRERDDGSTNTTWLAEDLRLAWGVESSVGARDGLVLIVTVDRASPANSTIATSAGQNTFPIRQLAENGFESLIENVALPQLQAGDAYRAVLDLVGMTRGTVIDRANVLTERQLVTLDADLRRLGYLGLPTLVYVQSANNRLNDQDLAATLLDQWAIDTGDDARGAMVLVVTVDEDNPEESTLIYIATDGALPIRQLTTEGYEAILANEALPALQSGDVYLGLAYAIRETINYAEYSPPQPAPLSDLQKLFQEPLNIVAAILVQVGILLYFLIPAVVDRRLTLTPSPRAMTTYVVITVGMASVVGGLGVLSHNRAAALAGLGVVVMAAAVLPLVRAGLLQVRRSTPAEPGVAGAAGIQEVANVN